MMTDPEMHAVKRGALASVRGCGGWPIAATLDEFVAAADRAKREVNRAITTWTRWRRRFDPSPARLEVGSSRVNIRHSVAMVTLEQRNEFVRLPTEPGSGSG
jgi:hypothetical protein